MVALAEQLVIDAHGVTDADFAALAAWYAARDPAERAAELVEAMARAPS